jgi:Cys-tRNA(Pro)/Cys-tRNA(Cys) deacylase
MKNENITRKMKKTQKTNAARLLDSKKISYQLIAYEVDETDLSAIHVAAQLDEPIDIVFKTLVLRGDKNGVFVCIIPADAEVNLKTAAKIAGNKNCDLIPMKDILLITGYIRGGCSPIGMKKSFPTYIHKTCLQFPYIYVSAGMRGLQIKITPADLINASNATVCELI